MVAMTTGLTPAAIGNEALAQGGGYCPSTTEVLFFYNGSWYAGYATQEPEKWYEGWFDDTYRYSATDPLTGNWITGHFSVSETACLLATESTGWATPSKITVETFHNPGEPPSGGGGSRNADYEGVEVGLQMDHYDSHGNCTSIYECLAAM